MGGGPLSRTVQQQLAQFLERVIEASKFDLKVNLLFCECIFSYLWTTPDWDKNSGFLRQHAPDLKLGFI